ncbi:MAG: hypothetical protein GM43_4785 [actinobacterium acMicro-4]|nr:MAG: hypothetical protein GM43_4785 [actinobacterium acMicro-4]
MDEQRDTGVPSQYPIAGLRAREVSGQTRAALRKKSSGSSGVSWSKVSLWSGIVSLALAPVFGIGVIPAILSIVLGHIAKHREPQSMSLSQVGLALSYIALGVGTAVLVFVALPIVFAFLVSAGYILSE